MAWRFGNYRFVKEGYLDNTSPGRTTGEIEFAHLGKVILQLNGDMQGDLKHVRMHFNNPDYDAKYVFDHGGGSTSTARKYLTHFSRNQKGEVGDILNDPYLYLEWCSEDNGRCVIELPRDCCTLDG